MEDEEYNVANFATLLSKTLIFSLPKMDEFNFSRFLKDENEILQAKDQHSRDFPTFRLHFGEFFDDFLPSQAQNPRDPNRVHRVSKKRRKSRATTRVGCFKISYNFKRWNTWAVRSGAGVNSELIPLIRTFAPVDDFSENTNNSKDCGLQFFSNLDRYGVRCITW